MAATATKKRTRFITPICPTLWAWLVTPNMRWTEEGEYSVDVLMTPEQSKALYNEVKGDADAQIASLKTSTPALASWKPHWPVKDYDGDDDQYRGMKVITFKQKIKSGFDFRVDVFDAHKVQIKPGSLRIGNGTKMRVCFNVRCVADNLNKRIAVLFHPQAAQIVELVKWESDYGFEATEGFTANGDAMPSDTYPRTAESIANRPAPEDPFSAPTPSEKAIDVDDLPF